MSNSEILDRLPPCDPQSEVKLIGCVLRDLRQLDRVNTQAEEFRDPQLAKLWRMILEVREAGLPLDADVLAERSKRVRIDAADLALLVHDCCSQTGITHYATYYAERIRETWQRRTMIHAVESLLQGCWDDSRSVDDILASCEAVLSGVKTGRFNAEPVEFKTALQAAMDQVDDIVGRAKHLGVSTGFSKIDDEVGGFFQGELAILAARPGIGKTSLAIQFAYQAATVGKRVYFATLEMSHVELALKLLCSLSGVSNQRVRNAAIDGHDTTRMVDAAQSLWNLPIVLHDWPTLRAADIRRAARRAKAEFVIVDYLTLLTPTDKNVKRYEQVAQLAKDLKAVARELNVPLLALAQLNREVDKGKECRPRLSNLRESGDIEQTADMVMLLYRPKKKIEQKHGTILVDSWDADLEFAKNRKGATPTFRLDWRQEATLYEEHSTGNYVAANNEYAGDFAAYSGSDF